MKKLLIILLISAMPLISAQELTICFYDIDDSLELTPDRLKLISCKIEEHRPDIIMFAGIKNKEELHLLKAEFPEFTFTETVNAADKNSHLVFMAKMKPEIFQPVTDLKYVIKNNIELPVRRGFIYAAINNNGYILHVLAAHLKNRDKHPVYNQTDMRRYEARLLRQTVNQIMKKNPEANILIMGNMNDTCGKSPIKDIYNRRFGITKRLFDLRPLDDMNVSWTFLSRERDEYERIDYAIVSSSLIPEIMFDKNKIISSRTWEKASSHRPLCIAVSCIDRPLWTKGMLESIFPNAIRTPEYISPPIGAKRKRGSNQQ